MGLVSYSVYKTLTQQICICLNFAQPDGEAKEIKEVYNSLWLIFE